MTDTIKQEKPLKVAFYLRVSTDEQAERYGMDMQRRALDAIVASRGTLDDGETPAMILAGEEYVYKDEGVSGTVEIEERPGFARMQEDIVNAPEGTKPFDIIAVFKIDRFARRLKILLNTIELLEDHDIKFISVHESIDTSTPFGRAILGIVGVLSELEMETTKIRTAAGRKEANLKGIFMGNVPPYGFKKNKEKRLEVFKPEADIVREIFDKVLIENLPINGVCRYLEERQVESPGVSAVTQGKRRGQIRKKSNPYFWSTPIITKILTNEIYIGEYYYNKHEGRQKLPHSKWLLSEHHYPEIIDKGTFLRTQHFLAARKKLHIKTRGPDDHVYLLCGLIKCAHCFDPERDKATGMQAWYGEPKELGKGSGNYSYYYKCRRKNIAKSSIRCGSLPLPASQIEEYVVDRIKELLSDPSAVFDYQSKLSSSKLERKHLTKDKQRYVKMLNGIPQIIESLKEQHAHSIITIDALQAQITEANNKKSVYNQKILELETKISTNKLDEGYITSFSVFNQKYSDAMNNISQNREEVRKLLQIVIDSIEIHSRPATDTDVIAGKKAKGQHVPHKMVMRLRLPQEYLWRLKVELDKEGKRFGDTKANLSG